MSKTIVITGGTGGIGLHTAIGLARTGARIVVTGRDSTRGEAAVARIRSESGNESVELVIGDLSDASSTDALAAALLERCPTLDVLVNNAGLMTQERRENADGIEADFAVNVVAPHRLTRALAPSLEAAAPSRVLVLTGGSAEGKLLVDDLMAEKSFIPLPAYSNTKRAAEAMSLALAEELAPRGIGVHVVYPGRASTAMTQAMTPSSLPWFMRPAWPLFRILIPKDDGGKSAEAASRSSVYAATTSDLDGKQGQYVNTKSEITRLHPSVYAPENQAAVMAIVDRV